MPEYIASYEIRADYFECGTFMPDSQPHYRTYVFEANDEAQARTIAKTKGFKEVSKDLFNPRPHLESLMEYHPVELTPKEFRQMELGF